MDILDFAGLREDAEHAVHQPEFGVIEGRARRVRRRQRVTIAASVAAVLVTAFAAGAGLASPWSERGSPAAIPSDPVQVPKALRYFEFHRADARNLYALGARSPDVPGAAADPSPVYRVLLAASHDAGASWTVHQLPASFHDPAVVLTVIGRRTVVVTRLEQAKNGFSAAVTTDSGERWTVLDRLPAAADQVKGAVGIATNNGAMIVADPRTGRLYRLKHGPNLRSRDLVTTMSASTGLWAEGLDGSNRSVVAHSTNGGRTWSTHVLGPVAKPVAFENLELASVDGRTVYALHGALPWEGASLFRSTDGGRSWKQVDGGAWPPSLYLTQIAVLPGGAILQPRPAENGVVGVRASLSTDHGRTFHTVTLAGFPDNPGAASLDPSLIQFDPQAGGYVLRYGAAPRAYLSTDGLTWRSVEVPH
jgi:hypothetical protein